MTSCVAWVGKMRGTLAEDQIHAASTRRAKSTRLAWELSVKYGYSTTRRVLMLLAIGNFVSKQGCKETILNLLFISRVERIKVSSCLLRNCLLVKHLRMLLWNFKLIKVARVVSLRPVKKCTLVGQQIFRKK